MSAEEIAELRARLRRLEDREEIRSLIAVYGRAVDDRDWESITRQYTVDAQFESAGGRSVGVEAIIDYYRERTADYVASYHYPHSIEITFIDDDSATGLVCAHAELTLGGDTVMVALRYHDDYRRVDGGWRFHERTIQLLYVLKLSDLPTEFASRLRVRWPGTAPAVAHIGADMASGRTVDPRRDFL